MKPVVRIGDSSFGSISGHENFSVAVLAIASPTVFVNGVGVGMVGAKWTDHNAGKTTHKNIRCAEGSSSVYVNGNPICRIMDKLSCGDRIAVGSSNVFAGG